MRKPHVPLTQHTSCAERCPGDDVVDEYVLNRLPQTERQALESHFERCPKCAENLMITKALVQALQGRKIAGSEPAD